MTRRLLGVELLDELRAIVREPVALFFSVLMPVGFFDRNPVLDIPPSGGSHCHG